MNSFLILITWPIVVIFGKAVYNWFQIEKQKKYPKHGRQILIVAVVGLLYQYLSGVRTIQQWEFAGAILLYQLSTYWFLFDGLLNIMRGKHWLYIGIPDKDDALTDQFFFKYQSFYVWSKIAMVPFIVYGIVWIIRLSHG